MADGTESVRILCELASERGLRVDMHCDESDDPMSRHIETLACQSQRLGLQGRVAGSHLTSMHSMDNYYVSKLLPLMREAGVAAIANPLINITLQGRHDTYPKRRGMTRVPELLAAGVPVAFGRLRDGPWYGLGSADMLEVAHMGLHVAQMTGRKPCANASRRSPRRLPPSSARLRAGARMPRRPRAAAGARSVEALRLRATRLLVLRAGKVVADATRDGDPLPVRAPAFGQLPAAGAGHESGQPAMPRWLPPALAHFCDNILITP